MRRMKKKKMMWFIGAGLLVIVFLIFSRIRFMQNGLGTAADVKTDQTTETGKNVSAVASEEQAESTDPSHISETLETNLVVDASVESPGKAGATYKVKPIDFTEEKAKALLKELSGQENAEMSHTGEDYWLDGADGSRLCFVESSLYYEKNVDADETLLSVLQVWDEEHRADRQEKDLDFLSLENCKAQVLAMMQRFTDMDTEILRVNAVSADPIQSFYKQLREEGEFTGDSSIDFSDVGDAYLVYGGYRQDGLAVYNDTEEAAVVSETQMSVERSGLVRAIVTKDGIRYFDMRYPMQIQEKKDVQLLSAREALDKALPALKNQILTQKLTIDRIYMEYVPIASGDYMAPDVLRPYWVIHYQTEDGYQHQGLAIRINAETGENLAYGK